MYHKYEVRLSEQERHNIQAVISNKTTNKSICKRANILLLADSNAGEPMKQTEICVRCGVSDVTVFNTLRDYCTNGIDYTLTFKRTKATNPPIVIGDVEARIVALACGQSPDGFTRWTVRLLTEKVIELKIMDAVSRETIRNTLKKHNLSLI